MSFLSWITRTFRTHGILFLNFYQAHVKKFAILTFRIREDVPGDPDVSIRLPTHNAAKLNEMN